MLTRRGSIEACVILKCRLPAQFRPRRAVYRLRRPVILARFIFLQPACIHVCVSHLLSCWSLRASLPIVPCRRATFVCSQHSLLAGVCIVVSVLHSLAGSANQSTVRSWVHRIGPEVVYWVPYSLGSLSYRASYSSRGRHMARSAAEILKFNAGKMWVVRSRI